MDEFGVKLLLSTAPALQQRSSMKRYRASAWRCFALLLPANALRLTRTHTRAVSPSDLLRVLAAACPSVDCCRRRWYVHSSSRDPIESLAVVRSSGAFSSRFVCWLLRLTLVTYSMYCSLYCSLLLRRRPSALRFLLGTEIIIHRFNACCNRPLRSF